MIILGANMKPLLHNLRVKRPLNGYILEEVYVEQSLSLESFDLPNHVYKLKRAFCGLKQALRAWYDRLNNFLLENDFKI